MFLAIVHSSKAWKDLESKETELEEKDATLQVEHKRRCAVQLAHSLLRSARNLCQQRDTQITKRTSTWVACQIHQQVKLIHIRFQNRPQSERGGSLARKSTKTQRDI